MARRFRKPWRLDFSSVLAYVIGLALLGLLVAGYGAAFEAQPRDQAPVSGPVGSVIFVPLDEAPPAYLGAEEREAVRGLRERIMRWLESFDPAILVLPSLDRGFSRVRLGEFQRTLAPLPAPAPAATIDPLGPLAERPVAPAPPPLPEALAALALRRPPDLLMETPVASPPAPPPAVYWSTPERQPVVGLPVIGAEQLRTLGEGFVVSGPTRLRLEPGEKLARVQVLASCGERALDLLAVRAVHAFLAPMQARQEQLGGPPPAWLREERTLLAHWQFIPGVRLGLKPGLEPLPGDRDPWRGADDDRH